MSDKDLIERLKMEAQIHAQEARTANATIAEIYQIVTGKTGEPGNWHGAEPVRKYIEELRDALKACAAVCAGETTTKSGLITALEKARAALATSLSDPACGGKSV